MHQYEQQACDPETIVRKEWILANGLGGYASGTISGINTRKYHGLLISGFAKDNERYVYLNSLEEKLLVDGHVFFISAHKYVSDTVYPRGFIHLHDYVIGKDRIELTYTGFGVTDISIKKEIRIIPQSNSVMISYRFAGDCSKARLVVRPLISGRNIHSINTDAPILNQESEEWDEGCTIRVKSFDYSKPGFSIVGAECKFDCHSEKLFVYTPEGEFENKEDWYINFQYDKELERGYEYIEDLYCPGKFLFDLDSNEPVVEVIANVGRDKRSIVSLMKKTSKLADEVTDPADDLAALIQNSELSDNQRDKLTSWYRTLSGQASDFVVAEHRGGLGIIAGYHWFGIWSRDSLIALKGILLDRDCFSEARKVLQNIADHSKAGLVPNILEEQVKRYDFLGDSSLWFILAVYYYYNYTEDDTFLNANWPLLISILERYAQEQGPDPHMDDDGLIVLESDGTRAASWMDAIADGQAVTPRYGKPVEIQALWYNALQCVKCLGGKVSKTVNAGKFEVDALIDKVHKSFNDRFWSSERGYLADVVSSRGSDWSLRPNQLFACSLPFPLVSREEAKSIVKIVEAELSTRAGLRTLDAADEKFSEYYAGNQSSRDHAYHQGTIWPWLLGPYAKAKLYACGNNSTTRAHLAGKIVDLFEYCEENFLDYIPEIISCGDMRPCGTIHQAWNVAELLDVYHLVLGEILQFE